MCSGQERLFAQQIFNGGQILYRRTFSGNPSAHGSFCVHGEKRVYLKVNEYPGLKFMTDLITKTTTAIFAAACPLRLFFAKKVVLKRYS